MKEQCGICGRPAILFLKGGKPHSWGCQDLDCRGWSKSAEPPPFDSEVQAAWGRARSGAKGPDGYTSFDPWGQIGPFTKDGFRAAVVPILERCAALEIERDALRIEVVRLSDDIAASADADIEIRSELGLGPDDADVGTVDRIRGLRRYARSNVIRTAQGTRDGATAMLETMWCIKATEVSR